MNVVTWIGFLFILHPSSFILPGPVVDSIMYQDPKVPEAWEVRIFHERVLPLWLEALDRPEKDLKNRSALTIAEAHRRGMKGQEAAVPALVRELEKTGQNRTVQVSVAKALIELDARDAAALLARAAAAAEQELRDLVEPALARWDYKPARVEWLARLHQPPFRRPTILAMQCLAAVNEEKAAPRLRELVLARDVPIPVRLEGARALGRIRTSGSEEDARGLVADATPRGKMERLLAATLLRQHKGDEAIRQLQALGRDSEPAVAVVALARLVEIDPKLVLPLLEPTLTSLDAKVRGFGVDVLHRVPSDAHMRLLADRLSDVHPDVRNQARVALVDLDRNPEWREIVRREATRILDGSEWRGLEQSALLMGQIDHKPAATRLLVLLNGNRGEAVVAAAWALRKLAIPDTLPKVLEYVEGLYRRMVKVPMTGGRTGLTGTDVDRQLSQLVQLLGASKYRPADSLLRQFIPPTLPENKLGIEARAAAAWALGKIHEGNNVPEIATMLIGRLNAIMAPDVEDTRVRRNSAISLGLMKSQAALPALRQFYPFKMPSLEPVNNASGWAIEQITGEKMPPPGPFAMMQGGWFLMPIR